MSFEKHLNKLAMNTQNINLIENRMVNSTVPENGSENSVESNLYKNCQKCGSENLLLISTKILNCGQCHTKFFLDSHKLKVKREPTDEPNKKIDAPTERNNKEFKTYELRKGLTKNKEPEVIDLLDTSDDESDLQGKGNSNVTLNVTNGSTIIQKVELSTAKNNENPKNNICFNDWNIKKSDLLPNQEKSKFNSFKLLIKAFRMGPYLNSAKVSNEATFTREDGINLKLLENDYHISITLGLEDIVYCAAIFNHPYYFLTIQIKDEISSLYYEQLSSLSSFRKDKDGFLSNELNKSIVFLVLNVKKSESALALSRIQEFCQINADILKKPLNSVFGVLNMAKSHELVHNCFSKDDGIAETTKFINKYTLEKLEVKYPNTEQVDVVIKSNDLLCLRDGEFLNDNIISFYLKYIQNELLSKEDRDRTHIFDTFFYEKLTQKANTKPDKDNEKISAANRRYLRVKNWTRNVNIFEKDFLIIPINKNNHWYLAIICYPYLNEPHYELKKEAISVKPDNNNHNVSELSIYSNEQSDKVSNEQSTRSRTQPQLDTNNLNLADESADEADDDNDDMKNVSSNLGLGPCLKMPAILIFDSLHSNKKNRVLATLKQYLQCEWDSKYAKNDNERNFSESLIGSRVRVPSQTNFFDCGIYLLQYVEHFFKAPIKDYNLPINIENWFSTSLINKQRALIKEIIIHLFEAQKLNAIKKKKPKHEPKVVIETVTEPVSEKKLARQKEKMKSQEMTEEDDFIYENMTCDESKEVPIKNRPKRYKLSSTEIVNDMNLLV